MYEKIPAERMSGIKGIGFRLEDGSIYDGNFDLMVMGEMQTEFINEIPQYRESRVICRAGSGPHPRSRCGIGFERWRIATSGRCSECLRWSPWNYGLCSLLLEIKCRF